MSEADQHQEHHTRLSRAEDDIDGLKANMIRFEVQMRGFGDILSRIEIGIKESQERAHNDIQSKRINPIALATVLVSMLSFMIGGSWLVSGQLSRTDIRLTDQQVAMSQLMLVRDRELDRMQLRIDRVEDRGDSRGSAQAGKAP